MTPQATRYDARSTCSKLWRNDAKRTMIYTKKQKLFEARLWTKGFAQIQQQQKIEFDLKGKQNTFFFYTNFKKCRRRIRLRLPWRLPSWTVLRLVPKLTICVRTNIYFWYTRSELRMIVLFVILKNLCCYVLLTFPPSFLLLPSCTIPASESQSLYFEKILPLEEAYNFGA